MPTAVIYTDGSCDNTSKDRDGGWGYVMFTDTSLNPQMLIEGDWIEGPTSSNRAEILAAYTPLSELPGQDWMVFLVTDSLYLIRGIRDRYDRGPDRINIDLWVLLGSLLDKHIVIPVKVSGHSKSNLNGIAHDLANDARIRQASYIDWVDI